MKNFLKVSFATGLAVAAFAGHANAQTVEVNALGSSGLFLELGLAADYSGSGGIGATCVWSESTKTVTATDTTISPSATDTGNAWVAWTPQSGSCTTVNSSTNIYAYLQTDSVVGNRCLFNGSKCTIAYPTNNPAPANLILATGEVNLPMTIANALNAKNQPNAAGTDIRPEDAEFAVARALTSCGTAVATGSQYLGLGYTSSSSDPIQSEFSTSKFNVVNFALPSSFTVTPVGATPILVVVNGDGSSNSFSNSSITNITSAALGKFLDGTYSYSLQVLSYKNTGNPATVIEREPLSGTYNTMEYNVPNTTVNKTSQDVGSTQPTAQKNCNGKVPLSNPMNIATPSGAARKRAIGTGEELKQVLANPNSLGYGFWSVANFAGYTGTAAANAKYLTVDGADPLLKSSVPYSTFNGALPTSGSTELADVDLHSINTTSTPYPIWSLLRLVNAGSTAPAAVTNLAASAAKFVSFGTSTSRPDFITPASLTVVRSHFIPPAGSGEPATAANGHVGNIRGSACTAAEAGGDVGGVVYTLTADSTYCTNNHVTTGQTKQRR